MMAKKTPTNKPPMIAYNGAHIGSSKNNKLTGSAKDVQGGTTGNDTMADAAASALLGWGVNDGDDVVTATAQNGNAVSLSELDPQSLSIVASNSDLYIQGNNNNSLELQNPLDKYPAQQIQSFIFADQVDYAWNDGQGANVDLSSPFSRENNINTLLPNNTGNTAYGGSGNDYLLGGVGSNDTLVGGAGNDVFLWGNGDANDIINLSNSHASVDLYNITNITAPASITVQQNANLASETGFDDTLSIGGGWLVSNFFGTNHHQLALAAKGNSSSNSGSNSGSSASSSGNNNSDDFALLVGINNYPKNQLRGCVPDVAKMTEFLQTDKLWTNTDITTLEDSSATRSHILAGITELASEVTADSDVMFYYAGHGYVNTGYLAPYDINNAITPSAMYSALKKVAQKLTTGHITLVIDSCYSGQWVDYFNKVNAGSKFTVISGSGDKQPGYDMGSMGTLFSSQFINDGLLDFQADANGDGVISTQEAYNWAKQDTTITSWQQPMMYDGSQGTYALA